VDKISIARCDLLSVFEVISALCFGILCDFEGIHKRCNEEKKSLSFKGPVNGCNEKWESVRYSQTLPMRKKKKILLSRRFK
jgi:hypothetical protein